MAKTLLWIVVTVTGTIGAFLPQLWGADDFLWSVIGSTIGGLAGIWFWYAFLRFS